MNWLRLIVVCWIAIGSMAAWGQATAEYGLAASKSAAATTATLDKLNRSSAAAVAAAGASVNRATDAGAHKAAPVTAVKTGPRTQRPSQVQAKPGPADATTSKDNAAPADATTTKLQPSGISLSRGSAATERARDNKYPGVVDLGSSAKSPEKAPKPKQPHP